MNQFVTKKISITAITKYALVVVFFLFCALLLFHKLISFDIWWHLKTGEHIIKTLTIPTRDFYSYTAFGKQWIEMSWLFEVAAYYVFLIAGINGLIIAKTFIGLLTFALLYGHGCKKIGALWTTPVFLLVVLLAYERFVVRPEVVSYLFLAIYLLLLDDFETHWKRAVIILPIAHILWTNMHGLSILGVIVVFCYCGGKWKTFISSTSSLNTQRIKIPLVLLTTGVIGASFINPYGVKGTLFPFELFQSLRSAGDAFSYISEFQPLWREFLMYRVPVLFVIVASICILSFICNGKNMRLFNLLLFVVSLLLALLAVRNSALFALISGYVICSNVHDVLDRHKMSALSLRSNVLSQVQTLTASLLIIVIAMLSMNQVNGYASANIGGREFGMGMSRAHYSFDAIDFIKEQDIRGNIFNFGLDVGDCLIWAGYPDLNVFADGRLQVYDEAFYDEYLRAVSDETAWDMVVKQYDIECIILDYTKMNTIKNYSLRNAFVRFIQRIYRNDMWKLIYFDSVAMIFVRSDSMHQGLIETYDNDVINANAGVSANNAGLTIQEIFNQALLLHILGERTAAERVLMQGIETHPHAALLYLALGNIYRAARQLDAARQMYVRAGQYNDTAALAFGNMAGIDFAEEKFKDSMQHCRDAIKKGLNSPDIYFLLAENYRIRSENEKAIRYYKRALNVDNEFVAALINLGILYAKAGKNEKARVCWTRVLAIDPSREEVRHNMMKLKKVI